MGKNVADSRSNVCFLFFLSLVVAIAFFAHSYAFNLDLNIAARGFSVLEVLQARNNEEGFLRDYPGGARLTTALVPSTYLYLLGDYMGIGWMNMLYAMILLEMCVVLLGAHLLWRAFFGDTDQLSAEHRQTLNLVFIWVAALLLASSTQRANLANFGFPFFHGQFYGFADGLRLATLAMVLRQRWLSAAVLFSFCFAFHPIKAAIVAGFCLPIVLYDWRSVLNVRFSAAVLISSIAALTWSLLVLQNGVADQGVGLDDFIDYTKTLQSHWYPHELGIFSDHHLRGLTPFLSLLLVTLVALEQAGWDPGIRRKLYLGLGSAICLTLIGLYIAANPTSASLVRISLVRASTLITLIAPLIVLVAVFLAWRSYDWLTSSAFVAFLGTSFTPNLENTTLSAAFSLFVFGIHFYKARKFSFILLSVTFLVALSVVWFASTETGWESALAGALPALLTFGLILSLSSWASRSKTQLFGSNAVTYILTIGAVIGCLNYALERTEPVIRDQDMSKAYKETQVWANQETPDTALFMVDPCRWYGWRDFSGRASIGTVREWYMTAWIYGDSRSLLETGQGIAQALGFDMEPFRSRSGSSQQICESARAAYYDPTFAGHSRIVDKYGVDFFVFENRFAGNLLPELEERAEFQNAHFTVVSAGRLR